MKHLKKFFTVLLAAAMFLIAAVPSATSVFAYTEETLPITDTWASRSIGEGGEADFYLITIPSSGTLKITLQALTLPKARLYIYDEDVTYQYSRAELNGASSSNPLTTSITLSLEPGTYCAKVCDSSDSSTGTYRIKAAFTSYGTNVAEPNDSYETAMPIELGDKITGAVTTQNSADFYKLTLTRDMTILLTETCNYYQMRTTIYDANLTVLYGGLELNYGTETNPVSHVWEYALNAGTYYIKTYPRNGNDYGRYTLKIVRKYFVSSIAISGNKTVAPGSSFTLKATASPSYAIDKTVTWASSDSSVASVDATGKVTANKIGKATITATAKDGSGVKKSVTVYVKPKKGTVSSLYRSGSRTIYVAAAGQYGATGYQVQYSTSSKFTKAKTLTMSSGSRYIKKLTNGKKYYVRVRAYYKSGSKKVYGSWSSAKSITPKA